MLPECKKFDERGNRPGSPAGFVHLTRSDFTDVTRRIPDIEVDKLRLAVAAMSDLF